MRNRITEYFTLSLVIVLLAVLLPATAMAGKPVCGDGKCGNKETCDSCPGDCGPCQAKAECGNGTVEGDEICDGLDLGGETCITQDFDGGSLYCTADCTGFDRSYCTRAGYLEAHYIDVGQGDAILILSPDGKSLLIDAGPAGSGATIREYLVAHNISTIDYLLISHYHADHLGAADEILNTFPVGQVFDRGETYSSVAYSDYVSAAGTRRTTLHVGDSLNLGSSLYADILQIGFGSDENDKSAVLRVTYGGMNLLFGGDCTELCEATFTAGDIDVYKVHHHGSRYSSSQSFLDATLPEMSVISAGLGNSYEHPHQETLDRLWGIDSDIYRTDMQGDVMIKCDETSCWANHLPTEQSFCGDGTCDLGEDCLECPSDCIGVTGGKPSKRYCCGNGICESRGEDTNNCSLDCIN